MKFTPITTPIARMVLTPDDMPLLNIRDIPQLRLNLVNVEQGVIVRRQYLPYRVQGMSRRRADIHKNVKMLAPLVDAQLEKPDFIAKYGVCKIINEAGKFATISALEEAFVMAESGQTNIHYQSFPHPTTPRERIFTNTLVMAVTNNTHFRTYPNEEDYLIKTKPDSPIEIHGTVNVFGRIARCTISHPFFEMRRFSNQVWEEAIQHRLGEVFPFLVPTGMFHSLKLVA